MAHLAESNSCTPFKSPPKEGQLQQSQLNRSRDLSQQLSSEDSNQIQNSHKFQSLPDLNKEAQLKAPERNNNLEEENQNEQTPEGDSQNNKPQSTGQKQTERKRRRKKIDADGRDYTCSCGKSYLSYPALYTHVKTKHNGEISITQNLRIPLTPSNPMTQSRDNLHLYKKEPQTPKEQPDDDHLSIEKIKQFIFKQFIKDRPKEALIEFRNSLKLREQDGAYISQILKTAEYGDCVKLEEGGEISGQRQLSSNSKSDNLAVEMGGFNLGHREEIGDMFTSSPEIKKFERIQVIRTVMADKHFKENNRLTSKSECKGLISCVFPSIPENFRRPSSKSEESPIDQVLGVFLSEFLKGVASNELINMAIVYFVCRMKDYFNREGRRINTSDRTGEVLIEESGELVGFLIDMENTYLKQPIVVCKLLFFFYRWMFKQQFTCKFVKFNQAG